MRASLNYLQGMARLRDPAADPLGPVRSNRARYAFLLTFLGVSAAVAYLLAGPIAAAAIGGVLYGAVIRRTTDWPRVDPLIAGDAAEGVPEPDAARKARYAKR